MKANIVRFLFGFCSENGWSLGVSDAIMVSIRPAGRNPGYKKSRSNTKETLFSANFSK
jgi:hypothetical protein